MIDGQKLLDGDGREVALFPIDEIYITQGEYGSISHDLAMDFVGWSNQTGQIPHYPYYAPVSMKLVAKNYSGGQAYMVWESLNEVHFADNTIDFMSMVFMHDDNPLFNVGDTVSQGDLIGRSGSSGFATGDHIHLNVAQGKYVGWSPTTHGGFSELTNSIHIYNALFVNDTTLYNDYGYPWKTYDGPTPPPPTEEKKKKYPWFIQISKRRLRNFYNLTLAYYVKLLYNIFRNEVMNIDEGRTQKIDRSYCCNFR